MNALRALARRVLVDLVVVFGALSLASLGGDAWWPLEMLAHFHGCWSLLLAPAALALFALRARLAAILTTLVVAVDLAFVVPFWYGPTPPAGPPDLRILQANVHVLNRSPARLLELVAAERPDVIVVFEYGRGWPQALAVLDRDYPHRIAEPRSDAFGIALWSKLPCPRLLVHQTEDLLPSIEALLEGPFGRIALFAVHPPRPGLTSPPTTRDAVLRDAAMRVARASAPAVLLGDFNTTSHAKVFREMLAIGGLRDARRGFGPRPTWPGALAPVGIAIDHVLVGDGIAVAAHRVGPAIGSDHRPLIVDLVAR